MNESRSAAQQQHVPTRSGAGKAVAITTAAIGALVLLGVGATSAVATVGTVVSASADGISHSIDTEGLTSLEVDTNTSQLSIEFADVDEASLEAHGQGWTFERDGDTLVVERQRWSFQFWCFGSCDAGARNPSTLTLPNELNSTLDADVSVGAGTVNVDGEFADLSVAVGAGEATLTGSAETLSVGVETGSANVTLRDVREADVNVSVGEAIVTLTGSAPSRVGVTVSVGEAIITLPNETYDVQQSASVGSINNNISNDPNSDLKVNAEVSVGSITLRY